MKNVALNMLRNIVVFLAFTGLIIGFGMTSDYLNTLDAKNLFQYFLSYSSFIICFIPSLLWFAIKKNKVPSWEGLRKQSAFFAVYYLINGVAHGIRLSEWKERDPNIVRGVGYEIRGEKVFYQGKLMKNVDVESFRPIFRNVVKNARSFSDRYLMKDKNFVYNKGEVVPGLKSSQLKVIPRHYWKLQYEELLEEDNKTGRYNIKNKERFKEGFRFSGFVTDGKVVYRATEFDQSIYKFENIHDPSTYVMVSSENSPMFSYDDKFVYYFGNSFLEYDKDKNLTINPYSDYFKYNGIYYFKYLPIKDIPIRAKRLDNNVFYYGDTFYLLNVDFSKDKKNTLEEITELNIATLKLKTDLKEAENFKRSYKNPSVIVYGSRVFVTYKNHIQEQKRFDGKKLKFIPKLKGNYISHKGHLFYLIPSYIAKYEQNAFRPLPVSNITYINEDPRQNDYDFMSDGRFFYNGEEVFLKKR